MKYVDLQSRYVSADGRRWAKGCSYVSRRAVKRRCSMYAPTESASHGPPSRRHKSWSRSRAADAGKPSDHSLGDALSRAEGSLDLLNFLPSPTVAPSTDAVAWTDSTTTRLSSTCLPSHHRASSPSIPSSRTPDRLLSRNAVHRIKQHEKSRRSVKMLPTMRAGMSTEWTASDGGSLLSTSARGVKMYPRPSVGSGAAGRVYIGKSEGKKLGTGVNTKPARSKSTQEAGHAGSRCRGVATCGC